MKATTLTQSPKPPATLSAAGRKWWQRIQQEYQITSSGGLLVLTAASEAFDRMKEAQAVISKEGLTVTDRHGQIKVHPCTQIERDSRSQLLAALRALSLDLEPLQSRPGRPSGSKSFGMGA